ncbi:hypothetical protein DY000_02052818 [Brassica cretica]|uniref:Uncharacterized protein n=1 Tax=Brassica cretica TaxID=69181 RepID=A0ABQ7AJC9_BRACR|nr:hypothetical protein DY000_02052818 [Brassica cretica]
MASLALIVDKQGDPASRILPYGYGPVYVVDTLLTVPASEGIFGLFVREPWKEPKLTSNLTELNFACLGALYTWDRILQTSLEAKGFLGFSRVGEKNSEIVIGTPLYKLILESRGKVPSILTRGGRKWPARKLSIGDIFDSEVGYPFRDLDILFFGHVQAIRAQLYGMISRKRRVVVMPYLALIVDKQGDPASRILPYGYGPVYVVDTLVAAGEMDS